MQSLDYKLKTSNTSYVTARHDVQYFPSSLSSFSPTTSRVCRIPLTSGTSFIDPESIKIAFRVRNTDGTNPLAPATPNPACFVQRVQVFANGQRCDDINYYGRTVAVHDLLKGREYNRNKAMEGFDEVNDPRIARAVHQGGYANVLLRPTMVGILRCGKMLPPQLNLVIEIEFADATTDWAGWSKLQVSNNSAAPDSGPELRLLGNQSARVFLERDGGTHQCELIMINDEALVQTKSLSTQLSLTTNQRNPGCLVIAGNTGNVVCNTSFTDLSDSRVKTEIAEADVAELLQLFDSVEAKQYKRPDMNGDLRLGFASQERSGRI